MLIFNALQTSLSGGIGRYCYELSKAMYNLEKDMKIVIRREDLQMFSFVKLEDLIIVDNITSSAKRNIYEQLKLPFIINKHYPQAIIHYPDSMAPILSKNKVIITVHDIAFKTLNNVFTWKTKVWKNIMTSLSVKKAYKIIAISDFTKKELEIYYGKSISDKTSVILNGFNDFSKEKINIENIDENILDFKNEKYILTVSTISPRKNIDGLIKAFNKSKAKEEYKLIIAGGKGWLSDSVFKTVEELNLTDKVIFTGKVNDDELKYLYKNCELLSYVSFYEGFGLPPLEAMSYGKACVVSNSSSIPEVTGNAALLVDPRNLDDISDCIDKILFNKNIKDKLINKIADNLEKFSWEKCAKSYIKYFDIWSEGIL